MQNPEASSFQEERRRVQDGAELLRWLSCQWTHFHPESFPTYTLVQTHTPAHVHALSRHPRAPFTLTHTTQMPAHTDMFCICISSPLHQTRGPMHTQNHTHSDTKFTHIHTQRHPHNTFTRTHKNSAHIFIHTCTNFIASTPTHTHTHMFIHSHTLIHTHTSIHAVSYPHIYHAPASPGFPSQTYAT